MSSGLYPYQRGGLVPGREPILNPDLVSTGFGVRFDTSKFDQLINGAQSYRMVWSRAVACSCRLDKPEVADESCTACKGHGYRYVHPNPEDYPEYAEADAGQVLDAGGLPIRALLEDPTMQPDWFGKPGQWVEGTAVLTVRGSYEIGYYDRFRMLDAVTVSDQVLTSTGTGTTVALGRDPRTSLIFPIAKVLYCGTLVKESPAVDPDPTKRYRLREDFTISDSGTLVWNTGKGLASGLKYTIKYQHHPVWRVVSHPRQALAGAFIGPGASRTRAEAYEPLPISAVVRMEFLGEHA